MALRTDRLARLSARIDELQALPAAQRAAWLDALPPEDADLRAHLDEMLVPDDAAPGEPGATGGPPDTLWWAAPDRALRALQRDGSVDAAEAPHAGQRIGPWRLLAPLGRGGMGVVWRAERCDGAFQRQVALKLPLQWSALPRLAERFARERDILAALVHPHIARLYDAGVGATGQPYLALELIDGLPLTDWADRARLDLRGRVGLMLQVLAAVQHAHKHLVVHRDLKPSNILVSADGQVHLLDFGIARLLDDDQGTLSPGSDLTDAGSAALTPTYAAPEQLLGQPISTAADLYALGVVLCELLAGCGPYRPEHATRAALEQAVLTQEPRLPSRGITAEAALLRADERLPPLRRQLRGDLDNIVGKALRKLPAERYDSADAMAQDLQCWLDGLPVRAHPVRSFYRLGKWLRRHRAAGAAGALALLALAGGAGLALWQADEARQQARLAQAQAAAAQREAQRAEAAQDFLIELFDAASPARSQGREPGVRELMAHAEQLLPQRLAQQPELATQLRRALVAIYLKLSDEKRALPLAEANVAELRGRPGGGGQALGEALLQLADVQAEIGRHEMALASAAQAEPLLPSAPDAAGRRPPAWLHLQARRAASLRDSSQLEPARSLLRTLVPQLAARHGAASWEVLEQQVALIVVQARLGQAGEVASLLAQVQPRLDAPDPLHAIDIARLQGHLGAALRSLGQWSQADRLLLRALAEYERLVGPRSSAALELLKSRAYLLELQGREREVDQLLQQAVALSRSFHGDGDVQTALVESFRVGPLIKLGQPAEAERVALAALRAADGQPGLRAGARRGLSTRLGLAQLFNGHRHEALATLQAVVQGHGDKPQWNAQAALAGAHLALGQPAPARRAIEVAIGLTPPGASPSDQLLRAKAQLTLALIDAADGRPDAAEAPLQAAQASFSALLPPEAPDQVWPALVRAQLLRAQRRGAEAAALEGPARRRWQKANGNLPPSPLWLIH